MAEEPDRAAMLSDLTAVETAMRSDLGALRSDVTDLRSDFTALRSDVAALEKRLEARMTAEHEETRRHFNIMVEKVEATVKLVVEVNAHHGIILDDHENRLKKIERRR